MVPPVDLVVVMFLIELRLNLLGRPDRPPVAPQENYEVLDVFALGMTLI